VVARLTRVYQDELARTRTAVSSNVGRVWNSLPAYNRADVPRFLAHALPIVKAGQSRAVALTSAYLSKKLHVPPVGLNPASLIGAAARNGVDPQTVYNRAFIKVWSSLKNDGDYQQAILEGLNRVESSAEMDVALASRMATLAFGQQSSEEIVAWRRVADASPCEFCSEIDGAVTGPDEPMPLHDHCGCTADPITRQTTASEDAPELNVGDVIGITEIQMHGELGPIIVRAGDFFTTEADLGE
jgi:hypothetical protein